MKQEKRKNKLLHPHGINMRCNLIYARSVVRVVVVMDKSKINSVS